ncbi:MAG: glycosyltransferase family 2 protein [Myxococcota bacterium]
MLSIIIPIYNEEETLPLLFDRLISASPLWKEDFEVILVDDGSSDNSYEIMRAKASDDSRFVIVRFSRNFGHQAAVSAGMRYARGDAVIIMDGDLQDPPETLPQFLDKWREGYDVVYAIRTKRKEGLIKRIAYASFYRILHSISDLNIPLDSGDFCVMDKKVVRALNEEMPEQIRFVRGLRAYVGFKQIGVTYERDKRAAGEVKYTFKKLMKLAVDGIFGFSLTPLRTAIFFGSFISLISFLVGIFFIVHRLFNFPIFGHYAEETPGLATLAVGIFFLGGLIMVMIGILGEYIGRIYIEVKKRPFFIVDTVFKKPETKTTASPDKSV